MEKKRYQIRVLVLSILYFGFGADFEDPSHQKDLLQFGAKFGGFLISNLFFISYFNSFLISLFIIVVIDMILMGLWVVMSG